MARLPKQPIKKDVQTEARTMEEQIVVWMAQEEGCMKEEVVILPPPDSCSKTVHMAYGIGQFHLLTILFVAIFLMILFGLTTVALKT